MFHFFSGVSKKKKFWTPSQIVPDVWYDADDSSTITLNGSTVSQWNDKSGNSRNLTQPTTASQPTYSTNSLNSKATIDFPTSKTMVNNAFTIGTTSTVFAVIKPNAINSGVGNNRDFITTGATGDNTKAHILFHDASSTSSLALYAGVGFSSPNVLTQGLWSIIGGITNGASSEIRNNGRVVATGNAGSQSWTSGIRLGANSYTTFYSIATYAEVIVTSKVLSQSDKQKIEGYLAWKWGLQHMLTSTHPYRYDGTLFGNYPKLWSPSELITALWYDGDDTGTITLNGSTVSQWNDKSGNLRNVSQATATSQPTYLTNGLNGKPVLTFDGGDSLANNIDSFYTSDISFFTVARTTSTTTLQSVISKNGASNREWYFGVDATNKIFQITNDIGSSSSGDRKASSTGNAGTNYGIWATSKSGTNVTVSLDGTTNSVTLASGTVFNGTSGIQIGNGGATTSPFNGGMAEIVVIASSVSDTDRQKLEGYLAHKWGLTANLPAGHPYKTKAPTL
jgi:hypothetical protein